MTVYYWVAQHIGDVFRNEPRNVGVLVQVGRRVASRFFGESEENHIDRRKLRGFAHPSVYEQWVDYWREQILAGVAPKELVEASGAHYRVVEGGQISDIDEDTIEDVARYLYALLVSEGGFQEALGFEDESETAAIRFEDDIVDALRRESLLAGEQELPFVPHPLRFRTEVQGAAWAHKPAFVQENGRLYVMESVDFTIRHRQRSRDHAGWSAYMFNDIKRQQSNADAIAIIRITDTDREHEEVENGLALLKNEADLVDWLEPAARKSFLDQRKELALTK